MKPTTRGRATRLVVSSLLESDLTLAEIADFAKTLLNDRQFSKQLGELLLSVADRLRHQARHDLPGDGDMDWDWLEKVKGLVKRRRVPKHEILSALNVLCPNEATNFRQQMSVSQILTSLATTAPRSVRDEFLKWLEKYPGGGDPYLEGIMKRK